jgi:hypothetical protein
MCAISSRFAKMQLFVKSQQTYTFELVGTERVRDVKVKGMISLFVAHFI